MLRPRLAAISAASAAALLLSGAGIEPRRRRGGDAQPGTGVIIKRERVPVPAPPSRPLPSPPPLGAEPRAASPGEVRIERRPLQPPSPRGELHWARWHAGHWWRRDAARARWLFWWNDHWWWHGPGDVMYVYVRGDYAPYRDGAAVVRVPESQPPPAEPPPTPDSGGSWVSPDGRRMVQVVGAQGDAFLYDRAGAQAVFMRFLAKGVERARFADGVIMLEFRDGRFALFDWDGRPR